MTLLENRLYRIPTRSRGGRGRRDGVQDARARMRAVALIESLESRVVLSGDTLFPLNFSAVAPLGSQIYTSTATDQFNASGETSRFTVSLSAGQSLSLKAVPRDPSVQAEITLLDSNNNVLGWADASTAGATVFLQNQSITTAGTYEIDVYSLAGQGAFDLVAALNASFSDLTNNSIGTAQDISNTFRQIGNTSGSVAGVVGTPYNNNAAQGATVTDATGSGAFNGDLSTVTDGIFLPRFQEWTDGTVYWTGSDDPTTDANNPTLEIDLGGSRAINGVRVQADNNDTYAVQWHDPNTDSWNYLTTIQDYSGVSGAFGVITRPDTGFTETAQWINLGYSLTTDKLRIFATGGDGNYAVSEVQVREDRPEYHAVQLSYGDHVTIAASTKTAGSVSVDLVDAYNDVLASGISNGTGTDVRIANYSIPYDGTFYIRIKGVSAGDYNLAITRNASLEAPSSPANYSVNLDTTGLALGWGPSTDSYTIDIAEGDFITVSTTTPGADAPVGEMSLLGAVGTPSQPGNTLDPWVTVYDPNGNFLTWNDNGDGDGRNANLSFSATASGRYTIYVGGYSGLGAYTVSVNGATGTDSDPGPTVASVSLGNGENVINYTPYFLDVTYSTPIDRANLPLDAFVIDSTYTADWLELISASTVRYWFYSLPSGEHTFNYTLLPGAARDYRGVENQEYDGSFSVDLTGPHVVSYTVTSATGTSSTNTDLTAPVTKVTFTFSESLYPNYYDFRGLTAPDGSPVWPSQFQMVDNTLTITFSGVGQIGTYTLVLGQYNYDIAGNPMDQDGDGTNGEDDDGFTAQFTIAHSPDIVANYISAAQTTAAIGDAINVDWGISNIGDADASAALWQTQLYLSPSPTYDPDTFFDTAIPLGIFHELNVAAGSGYTNSQQITLPGYLTAGTWYLVADVNFDGLLAESTKTNNIVISTTPIELTIPNVDLTGTTFGVSNEAPSAGDTISLTWSVTNNGSEPTNAYGWIDRAYLSTTPTLDISTATYLTDFWHNQGGPSSPLGSGSSYDGSGDISLPSGLQAGETYYIIIAINADGYWRQAETDTSNNTLVHAITIAEPASDLTISVDSSSLPSSLGANNWYWVNYTVTNQGTGSTTASQWYDSVYLSDQPYLTSSAVHLSDNYVPGLYEAGSSYGSTLYFQIPGDTAPGYYYLVFVTDSYGQQSDTDESNNSTSLPISIGLSDLVVTDVSAPPAGSSGSSIYVTWTDLNQGSVPTATTYWYDTIYYSPTGVLDGSETVLYSRYVYSGGLDANSGYGLDAYFSLPSGLPNGVGYLIIQTDIYNYNGESDQSNNIAVVPIVISSSDLVVSAASVSESSPSVGQSVNVSWAVTNQSSDPTVSSYWYDAVYFSTTGVLDGSQVYLGDYYVSNPGLAGGSSYSVNNQNVTIPYSSSTGAGYLIIVTDVYNYEYEADESNNTYVIPLTLHGPDLAVTSANSSTSSAVAGNSITVSYTVANQGDSPAVNLTGSGWYDEYFISTSPTFDGSARSIGSYYQSGVPLAPGGSLSVNQQPITLPGNLTSGQYYLYVFTDTYARYSSTYYYYYYYSASPDKNLTNNVSVGMPITISTPDLTVTAASAPSSAVVNQNVNVSWTVQNTSSNSAAASYWSDLVYLSDTPDLSGSYYYLGSFGHSGGLASGASYNQSGSVQISNNLGTGAKYLVIATNRYNEQGETNFGNNLYAIPITLSAPDLTVSNVSTNVTTASVNQSISVSWNDANSSDSDTGATYWYDRIWLSPSPDSLSNAVSLGDYYISNSSVLAAHGSLPISLNATIPNNLAAGTYYLIVQTDIYNYQGETNENNNWTALATPIVVGRPDLIVSSATAPTDVVDNQVISVSWTVTNQDTTYSAPGPWYDYVHLVGPNGYDQYLGLYYNGSLVPLAAGASYTQTVNVTIPNNAASGEYSIVIETNYYYYYYYPTQGESDSTNNSFSIPITIGAPDLTIDTSTTPPTAPSTASAGQNISVVFTVNNVGTTEAPGPWADAIYLSPTPTFNSSTAIYQANIYTSSIGASPLGAGSGYQTGFNFNLQTNGLSGSLYLLLVTDAYNSQGETNEANNLVALPITITAPDLQVQNLAISPNSGLQTGNQVTLSWSDANTGNSDVSSSFSDLVTITNLTTGQFLTSFYVTYDASTRGAIAAGSSAAQQVTFQIPDGFSAVGNLQFSVQTDINNTIAEGNASGTASSNNTANITATTVLGPYADLTVTTITPPATAWSGQTITVTWKVQNQGTAATTGSWTDAIYVQSVSSGVQTLLGTVANPIGLAINQSYTRAADFKLPIGISGDYVIVVKTNSNNGQFEANTANNNVLSTSFPVSLTPYPDLQVSTVTVPSQSTAGQPVTISWTVTNSGTGGTDVPSWNDSVYLSTTPTYNAATAVFLGSVQNPSFLAVGESYGSSLTATIPSNLSGPFYAIIRTDSSNTEYEYTFENNNSLASTSTINVVPAPDPGFIHVQSVTVTPNPVFAGQVIQVNWTDKNTGTNTIPVGGAGYWDDGFALSQDTVWTGNNGYWLGGHQGNAQTTDLLPGQTSNHNAQVTLPQNLAPGTWYLIVVPDTHYFAGGNGQIGAGNIPRDQGYFALTINLTTQPDLQVTSASADTSGTAGGTINASWTVANKGVGPTGSTSWTDSVYLSTSSTFQLNNSVLLGSVQHNGVLGTNEAYASPASGSFTLPTSLSTGTYYLFVVTDTGNSVFEYNANYNAEANNTRGATSPIQVTGLPVPPKPDLTAAFISPPASGASGQPLSISWSVTNSGAGDANGAWYDQIILSHDGSLATTGDNVSLGYFYSSSGLAAGTSYTQNQTVTLPIGISGGYTLFVVANSTQSISETATNNNSASSALSISLTPPPDLQVTNITVPAGASGQSLNVQWTVTNTGTGATPAGQSAWTDKVYFSANPSLNGTATLLGTVYHNGALNPGDSYPQSQNYVLPNGISGNFYIIIQTDAGSAVFEGTVGELNNVASASVAVTLTPAPDLQIQSVTAPTDAIAGQPITVSWTTVNSGAGATPNGANWYEAVYLSRDQFLNKSTAIYLGSVQNPSGLAAGATYINSLTANVPGSASGPYYVFVVTDSSNVVYEGPGADAQTNNGGSSPTATVVTLPPQTDLTVGTITVPATGIVGQAPSVPITFQVTNISGNTAYGTWDDAVYLSSNPTWDPSDPLIALVSHSGDVLPGGSYTGSTSALLPAVAPGTYYIIVRADIRNNVRETNDTNNTVASSSTIAMDMQALTLDIPVDGTIANGQDINYRVQVEAGKNLVIDASFAKSVEAEFYVRFGAPATRNQYDAVYSNLTDLVQDLLISNTHAGNYYILLHGREGATSGSAFTLKASTPGFSISSVTPNVGSNVGQATTVIHGLEFTPDAVVTLVQGGVTRQAVKVLWKDSTTLWATFNLTGLATGSYDVQVTDGGKTAVQPNSYTVTSAPAGNLEFQLVTSTVRPGGTSQVTIVYRNTGQTDIAAPLFVLSADGGLMQVPGQGNFDSSSIQFLGINANGPAGILTPGFTGQIVINFRPSIASGSVNFTLSTAASLPSTIDWSSAKSIMKNPHVSSQAWDAIFANFVAIVGNSTSQYVSVLDGVATYLSQIGQPTSDLVTLVQYVVQMAGDDIPAMTLVNTSDTTNSAPGIALSIDRSFTTPIENRFRIGRFGRGWTDQWDASLRIDSNTGEVAIIIDGASRLFAPSGSGYLPESDPATSLVNESGTYTFRDGTGLTYVFRPDGSLGSISDTNGNRVTAVYTGNLLTQLVSTNGDSITFAYNALGRVSQMTDPVGRITTYSYDASGEHLLQVSGPLGTENYTYSAALTGPTAYELLTASLADGTQYSFSYDTKGRLISRGLAGGAQTSTYSYGPQGQVSITDPRGATETTLYNIRGQASHVYDALGNATTYGYDPNGNLTSLVAPGGISYNFTHDARGNVTSITDPLGNTSSFTYNSTTNAVSSATNANGKTTSFGYDSLGNLLSITYPGGQQIGVVYNPLGEATQWINARGQAVTYTYNSAGLVATSTMGGVTTTYTYDAHRNVISASTPSETTTFTYDSADRLTQVNYPGGKFLHFSYDARSRRTQSVDQSGYTINYAYNSLNQLTGLTDGGGNPIVTYTYDAAGNPSTKTLGNGTSTSYSYDLLGRTTGIINYAADGVTITSESLYTYDALGRRTSAASLDGTWSYSYDANGQLTEAVFAPAVGSSLTDQDLAYQYDAVGNLLSVVANGVTTNYSPNASNQYTAVGATTYGYDLDGNLVTSTTGGVTTTYQYDALNRLTGISTPAHDATPADQWSFSYDPFGNLVKTVHNGATTTNVVDPSSALSDTLLGVTNVVATYDGGNNLIERFIYGTSLVAMANAVGMNSYYNFDGTGSTVGVTGSDGSLLASYAYLPFGGIAGSSGASASPYQFNGQYGVSSLGNGLSNMHARFYSSDLGRFLSQDPAGLVGGINPYTFGNNNPISNIDPWGLWFIDIGISAGAGWGGTFGIQIGSGGVTIYGGPGVTTPGAGVGVQFGTGNVNNTGVYVQGQGAVGPGVAGVAGSYSHQLTGNGAGTGSWEGGVGIGIGGSKATGAGAFLVGAIHFGPEDPDNPSQSKPAPVVQSHDPNEKIGPIGYGDAGFIVQTSPLSYRVSFENDVNATASARTVTVIDTLDPSINVNTLQLTAVNWGSTIITIPAGQSFYNNFVPLNDGSNHAVQIQAGIDYTTNTITWTLTTIDLTTGQLASDGFLPPNNDNHDGEGYVTFTVMPKAGLPTGTVIANEATIIFDTETPIPTNQVVNTIDAGAPTSAVATLPASSASSDFTVSWSGQDDDGGSGIASYDVYVSDNGGAFSSWLSATTELSATYHGVAGHTYAFYSRARDNVGNTEAAPASPDAQTLIEGLSPPPSAPTGIAISPDTGLLNNDGITTASSITLSGSLSQTNLTVRVYDNTTNTDLGTAVVNGTSFSAALNLAEGTHVLNISAVDSDQQSTGTLFTVVVDATAPSAPSGLGISPDTGKLSNDGLTNTGAVSLTGSLAESGLSVSLFDTTTGTNLGAADVVGTSFSKTLNLAPGTHAIQAIATDVAGNSSTAGTFTVIVDNTAPTITSLDAVSPNPRGTSLSTLNVTFSKPIDLDTFDWHDLTLTRDGVSNLITNAVTISFVSGSTYQITGLGGLTLTDGTYELAVSASGVSDAAGNSGSGSASSSWLIDTTAPTSHVLVLSATQSSPNFNVSWSGVDNSGGSGLSNYDIYVSDNGGTFTPWLTGTQSTTAVFAGAFGHTYGFYSVARDVVGNTEATPAGAQATTTVVSTGTSTSIVSSVANPTYGDSLSFTATVSMVAGNTTPTGTVQFFIDGATFGAPVTLVNGVATSDAITTLGAGSHTITTAYSGDGLYPSSNDGSLALSIAKANLTIKAKNADKVYGQDNPVFSAMYSGFKNGDTSASLSALPVLSTLATSASSVGQYEITASGAASANYEISYQTGTLTISKAHLTVTADNKTMGHGDAVPSLTYHVDGLVNGDVSAVVTGAPSLSTTATSSSAAGQYAITISPGSLTASNYDFTLVPGTLTVTPKVVDVRVTWGSGSHTQSMSILGLNRTLPFTTIKAIDVIFSDDVSVDSADLSLISTLTAGKSYTPSDFTYDPATHRATWKLANPLDIDKLKITLDGDPVGHDGIHGPGGSYLGAYSVNFSVLPGDFNGNGTVDSVDLVAIRNGMLGILDAALDIWADIDGDGDIDVDDYSSVKKSVGKRF